MCCHPPHSCLSGLHTETKPEKVVCWCPTSSLAPQPFFHFRKWRLSPYGLCCWLRLPGRHFTSHHPAGLGGSPHPREKNEVVDGLEIRLAWGLTCLAGDFPFISKSPGPAAQPQAPAAPCRGRAQAAEQPCQRTPQVALPLGALAF